MSEKGAISHESGMRIKAIEVEVEGVMIRFAGSGAGLEKESSWPAAESFKYTPEEPVVIGQTKCRCGHFEREHLPECIYKVEGCECGGYAESNPNG
jgi:hypothetical protein